MTGGTEVGAYEENFALTQQPKLDPVIRPDYILELITVNMIC